MCSCMNSDMSQTKPTTKWKNRIFENIDEMIGTITGNPSASTNDFNYLNIQLPTMEGFTESLYSGLGYPRSNNHNDDDDVGDRSRRKEPMDTKTGDNPPSGGVDPLTSEKYPEYANQDMAGLNASETRVHTPSSQSTNSKTDKKTTETFATTTPDTSNQEGFSISDKELNETDKKRKEFMKSTKNLLKQPNLTNIQKFIVILFEHIPEMFFIPEMLALSIVRVGKDKSNELKHKMIITKHLKSFVVGLMALYITLNWWHLWLYTDHAYNFEQIPEWGIFQPISLIVEPILSPLVFLNYYLIQKRLEPEFYNNWVVRLLDNKSVGLSVLFILIHSMYPYLMNVFSSAMKQVFGKSRDASPMLYVMVMMFCIYNYIRNSY